MAESAGFSECLPPRVAVFDGGPFSWPYLVFFNSHSAVLATGDTTVLDAFAHNAAAFHVRTIGITAHVDAAETGPADRDLDRRRADSVRIYLAKSGIVSGAIFFRPAIRAQVSPSDEIKHRHREPPLRRDPKPCHQIPCVRRWIVLPSG